MLANDLTMSDLFQFVYVERVRERFTHLCINSQLKKITKQTRTLSIFILYNVSKLISRTYRKWQ